MVRRLPLMPEGSPLLSEADFSSHLFNTFDLPAANAITHVDLLYSAYPVGLGMAFREWFRRCANTTREHDGALVTRIPGTTRDFAITLKDGRTFNMGWLNHSGWLLVTCIGGTMSRTRKLNPHGKTGAQVVALVSECWFIGRPERFAHDVDMGEVPAPVTHDDGKPDTRYTVRIEGTGTPEPRPEGLRAGHTWVARFCGEMIGSADYPEQAAKLAKEHAAERNRILNSMGLNDPLRNVVLGKCGPDRKVTVGDLDDLETMVRSHHPAGRRKWSREEWEREAIYIYSVQPSEPGSDFGNRPETFRTYCDMQARFAAEDGFPQIAETIRRHSGD